MNRFRARLFVQVVVLSGMFHGTAFGAPFVVPAPVQAPAPCPASASVPAADVEVTGQVVYGTVAGADTAATVDIVEVYNNNPAYMRLKQYGLSETQGRGKSLFEEARASTNKALAAVARRHGVDVITIPGGVTSDSTTVEMITKGFVTELNCVIRTMRISSTAVTNAPLGEKRNVMASSWSSLSPVNSIW